MPIKKSLRIILVLFSIIPAIIVGLITYPYVENTLISSSRGALNSLAQNSANQINSLMQTQFSELKSQCSKNFFLTTLGNLMATGEKKVRHTVKNPSTVKSTLNSAASRYSYCSSFSLYDSDLCCVGSSGGNVLTNSSAEYTLLKDAVDKQDFNASAPVITIFRHGKYFFIDIIHPIFDKKEQLLGYMVSTVRTSYFKYIFELSSFGQTGQSLLLTQDGTILYAGDERLIGDSFENKEIKKLLSNSTNDNPVKSIVNKFDQTERLFSITNIPETEWYFVVHQEMQEIIHPANLILVSLFVCCILVFLIACFASIRFSQYYTKPVFELRDTMKKVADGDFTIRCQINSQNEIGELAKSFNKMIHIIQKNYNDLADMHEKLLDNEEEIRSNYNHIEYLAYHDLLTNLPNKLSFLEEVDKVLEEEEEAKADSTKKHAIYFIDLDNFKTINDTLGHDFGDEVLSSTGKRLISLAGESDLIARVGGDEFLIFKYEITSQDEALAFGDRMLACFGKPFNLHNETLYVSLSIGIAIYPDHGKNHKILVKNADIAMYHSKMLGKNRVSVFDAFMSDELNRNSEVLDVLRSAIENHEVYLKYQPQVDIATNRINGFEALMRINSKKLGELSPNDFIPIAEESGLIIKLGFWALKEACRFTKFLFKKGYPPCTVSVNISSIQLNEPGFVDTVIEIIEDSGLAPQYLELELTESTLISSLVDTAKILNQLKSYGIHISLDDFGTGYSSLNYLTNLPINTLKIDKSFIDNICVNTKDTYIAKSIIMLAHRLNVTVIAEGVESDDQLDLLKAENCDVIQGFLFSKPLLPAELLLLLREGLD